MNRRSGKVSGLVRFPVSDSRYANTNEGGMFVRLVVLDRRRAWMQCCGGYNHAVLDECFVRDDKAPMPDMHSLPAKHNRLKVRDRRNKARELEDRYVGRYFPGYADPKSGNPNLSTGVLAAVTLGSTGWSGLDNATGEYWHCTVADLAPEGKALYGLIRKMYPGCKVRLLTFLDT